MISSREARDVWRRYGAKAVYPLLGVLLFAGSFMPSMENHGTQVGGVEARPFDLLAVLVIAVEALPLVVCRQWPVVCSALVALGFSADQLLGYHSLAGTALPIVLICLASRLEQRRRLAVGLLTLAFLALAVALAQLAPGEPISELTILYLALGLAWGIGSWLRATRAAEAERRLRVAEETRQAERSRIARELHDVVTHHVTAMVVQAEAARYLTAAPDRLDQSLTAVTDTGRQAITDLRHLLDLLNPDHGTDLRVPVVGRIRTLVEQTRRAGQPVEFSEHGTPAESTGSGDLVAYRVVQEALTNALKYAHGSRTSVRVQHGDREITVAVGTDGSGARSGAPGGSGRGLAGLRERVDVLGGEFSAGDRTGGGFLVRARIPAGNRS
ncbi:Oxygen sensor histidine kinase NreB [Streptomyces sp. YIM 130001]|uniref:sensor histidine kinase n=1 Tax=Streptomyces sp. YIM 130001 TaxID=2259644 RepID=UPI000E64D147|nr:histidine kinase [Streptomyces sp. YIM 130001]RII11847.1 Oxygen sensor histidine kinase NreB [Streptomyces sp. YIM 130001]